MTNSTISSDTLTADVELQRLFPHNPDTSRITMWCAAADYSASRIAHAVEDCDAQLINLNVVAESPVPGTVAVELRVGIRNGASVVRSLARYGYSAIAADSEDELAQLSDQPHIPLSIC
mgnify:FL=1